MSCRILIVAAEAGSAAYLRPLFERLKARHEAGSWRVILGPGAVQAVRAWPAQDLPLLCARPGEPDRVLDDWTFDRLLSSATAAPVEAAAWDAARRIGAKSSFFIDTWYGYARRLATPNGPIEPDHVFVVDARAAVEAAEQGIPAECIVIVGQPAWEGVRPLPPAPSEDVLFVSQPIARLYGTELGYDEGIAWRTLCEARALRPQLFGRLRYGVHPEQPGPDKGLVGDATVETDCQAALRRSGTVVGMFSSLLTDALLAERRVVSLQPGSPEGDMCPLSRHGRIARVGCADDLIDWLEHGSESSGTLSADLQGSLDRLERHILSDD